MISKFKYHVGYQCGPSELVEPEAFRDCIMFFGVTSMSSGDILHFCNEQVAKIDDMNFVLANFMYEPFKISSNEQKEIEA